MKKLTLTLVMVFLASVAFGNGLSLNSIGPKSVGMGGAFVAVANDASAIYWNPAGIAGQGTNVSVFMTDIIPMATYKMDLQNIDAEAKKNHYLSPNIFATYSMGKLSLGIGAYVPSGLGAEWDKADFGFETMSKLGVFQVSPTVAYQVSEKLSVGATFNYCYGMMEMKRGAESAAGMVQYTEDLNGTGLGAALGLKFDATDQLSIGLSYKTPTTISLEGDASMGMDVKVKRDIEWPTWVGAGLAYNICENWLIAVDGQWSDWGSSMKELVSEMTGAFGGPGTSMTISDTTKANWESQLQIRVGTEYKLNDALALRGGYYYDPAPAPDETLNILFPSSTNHALTAGIGFVSGSMLIDFGLEYLIGAERDIALSPENEMPGQHQMNIFSYSLGLGYKF